MDHPFQCRCGAVRGHLAENARARRGICFCRSCQAWAHYLGREDQLDGAGGTGVLMTQPHQVAFSAGIDRLACARLTPKGPLRWYAECCRSPIGNTTASARLPYLGLMTAALQNANTPVDATFGPVRLHNFTQHARGDVKPRAFGLIGAVLGVLAGIAAARLSGAWRDNPFFYTGSNTPIAAPLQIGRNEREALYAKTGPVSD